MVNLRMKLLIFVLVATLISFQESFALPMIWNFSLLRDLSTQFLNLFKGGTESLCAACNIGFRTVHYDVNSKNASEDDVERIALLVCNLLRIEKPSVCAGITKLYAREATEVLRNIDLEPNAFCSPIFENSCGDVKEKHNWAVSLPPGSKPPVKPIVLPKPNSPVLRVLHLSDIHLDLYYKTGSNANCGEPLCCRETSGVPTVPSDAAGLWGDYRNCDTPLNLLENLLDHINKTHKIDYVIWTGDIQPHDIWNYTRDGSVKLLHRVSSLMTKYLGRFPIFPALGNHESTPVDSFPIPSVKGNDSISWLYKEVIKAWSPWLPKSSLSTLKRGAYYSVLVYPGFRIISLNTNYCNNLNWWLVLNSTDPAGQLKWLIRELQMAENKGEKVHIIGHIPPGTLYCLGVWSSNYYKIINRYESTVAAQFFGHQHWDEFEIFYDEDDKHRATSIAYVGPGVTTYNGVNPGYRTYSVDGNHAQSTWAVLDHDTFYTNLTEANALRKPIWQHEYSAKKAFNMNSLSPADWDNLTIRFRHDDDLFQKFYRYHEKMSDYNPKLCENECKSRMLCQLRRGRSDTPC